MMRIRILAVAVPLMLANSSLAYAKEVSTVTVTGGTRVDNLDWNIAGTSPFLNYVNILSELSWSDLEIYNLKVQARTLIDNNYYLRGYADYGVITDGTNQDSDYRGNDRTLEYSRSNNSADEGSVWDISIGMGLQNRVKLRGKGVLFVNPVVGLSYHKQNLVITNGFQTIPPTGPFGGLNSTYEARWRGPWAGVDLSYNYDKLTLYGTLEYHLAFFRAEADWNLRTDFAHPKSFEHWANGSGVVASFGGDLAMDKNWSVSVNLDIQDWSAEDGTDRTYFSDGTSSDTPLNEVNWESRAVMVGLNYKF